MKVKAIGGSGIVMSLCRKLSSGSGQGNVRALYIVHGIADVPVLRQNSGSSVGNVLSTSWFLRYSLLFSLFTSLLTVRSRARFVPSAGLFRHFS